MICNKIVSDKNCNTVVQEEEFVEGFVYVYVLQLNKSFDESLSYIFIRKSKEEDIVFDNKSDGFYILYRIKVPTDDTKPYYYKEDKFYHNDEEISLEELISVNPETTGLDFEYFYYFQLCNLKKCYIKVCKEIFNSKNRCEADKNLTYKRDLIWSAINTLVFMVELEQYEEAERLLEKINGCNGICPNNNDCGCI